jgi:cytochrome c oxidase subunit 2
MFNKVHLYLQNWSLIKNLNEFFNSFLKYVVLIQIIKNLCLKLKKNSSIKTSPLIFGICKSIFTSNQYNIPSVSGQKGFQDPASPVMNGLLDLHDYVFFFIIVVLSVVVIFLIRVISYFSIVSNEYFSLKINKEIFNKIQSMFYKELSLSNYNYNKFKEKYPLLKPFFPSKKDLMLFFYTVLINRCIFVFFSLIKYTFILLKKSFFNIVNRTLSIFKNTLFINVNSKLFINEELQNSQNTVVDNLENVLENVIIPTYNKNQLNDFLLFNTIEQFSFKDTNFSDISFKEFDEAIFFNLNKDVKKSLIFEYSLASNNDLNFSNYDLLNSKKSKLRKDKKNIKNLISSSSVLESVDLMSGTYVNVFSDEFFFFNSDLTFFEESLKNDINYLSNDFFFLLNNEKNFDLELLLENEFENLDEDDFEENENSVNEFFNFKGIDFNYTVLINKNDFSDSETLKTYLEEEIQDVISEVNNEYSALSKISQFWNYVFFSNFSNNNINLNELSELNYIKQVLNISKEEDNLEKTDNVLDNSVFQESIENEIEFDGLDLLIIKYFSDINDDTDIEFENEIEDFILNNWYFSSYSKLHSSLKIGYFNHSTQLEIIWTIIPIIIIGLIITPSFFLMYAIDEDIESLFTVKVIGHQWYWNYTYEIPSPVIFFSNNDLEDFKNENTSMLVPFINSLEKNSTLISASSTGELFFFQRITISFDSYMLDEVNLGEPRLLSTDQILVIPKYTHVNCIVTAADVLHSWAIPSLGIKIDAVPGRLNRVDLFIEHEGMFFGQCSELCGVNHSFMPIQIECVPLSTFLTDIIKKIN